MDEKKKKLNNFIIPSVIGLGTGLRAGSAIVAGQEAMDAYRYNASAIDAEIKTLGFANEINTKQINKQIKQLQGQQITTAATSGLAVSGSIVDIMADTAAQAALQNLISKRETEAQRIRLKKEQEFTKFQAKQARTGSYFEAFGELAAGTERLLNRK